MRKEITIMCNDGKEYIVTEIAKRYNLCDLLDHRIFEEDWSSAQCTLMALTRGSKFALEHGLACPRDFKNAVKKIEGFKKY